MRKHLYLITVHENDDLVGNVQIFDKRFDGAAKNEETRITTFNKNSGEFNTVGRRVGMGYADFEDQQDYESSIGEVIKKKLSEIDDGWLEKANVDEVNI